MRTIILQREIFIPFSGFASTGRTYWYSGIMRGLIRNMDSSTAVHCSMQSAAADSSSSCRAPLEGATSPLATMIPSPRARRIRSRPSRLARLKMRQTSADADADVVGDNNGGELGSPPLPVAPMR